ncbi:oligosaccharide flippase family protein [bacterium]|jgi:O-antigen/teichoic acid export membrane protein|nr:oligosaccharide flippase family protein [bacterium]MBT3850722.1 oligosaccharide flippase family protein [bacterium]MBT4634905.1 oligosaccharide flippase family protein [bacterium]|tara:strand:+ start:526 stop:1824 length:1299 start_codon:yes stop_codon:yes gene_type:complete
MIYEELKNRIIKNFKIIGSGKILGGILSALTLLIIGRFLGVKEFGIFSIVISIVEILNIIFSLRVWDTSVKFIGENIASKNLASKYLSYSFILSSTSSIFSYFAILILTLLLPIESLDISEDIKKFILIYSFAVLFISSNETIDGILRTFDRYKEIFKINVFTNLFRFCLILFLLLSNSINISYCLSLYVLTYFFGLLLRFFILSNVMKNNEIKINFLDLPEKREKINFIKFMLNAHFSNILNLANDKNLGVVVVGFIAGPFYAGLYRAARAIVKIIRRIMDPVLEIVFPELVKLEAEKDFKNYKKIIVDSTKLVSISSIIIGLTIFIFAPNIISIFFGEQFLDSESALKILIFAMIAHNASYWVNPSMLSLGRPDYLSLLTIITTTVYCISLYFMVEPLKADGAAASLAIRNLVTLILGTYLYTKVIANKS